MNGGEDVDIEEELKKRITAEDPVDGELEVTFEVTESENEYTYDVEAKATDKNENETIETFQVIVEIKVVKEEIEEETIAFETVNKNDASLNKGTTKVSVEGETGLIEVTYEVNYINGEEESREKVKEEIIKEAKDKVVLNGTKVESNSGAQNNSNTGSTSNSTTNNNSKPNSNTSNNSNSSSNLSSSKPKPENKPNIKGPAGSTFVKEEEGEYLFSYNDSSLPGGGKITSVVYNPEWKQVFIGGLDKSGNNFAYSGGPFFADHVDLSNEAFLKLQSVEDLFLGALK